MDRPKLLNCGDTLQISCPPGQRHGIYKIANGARGARAPAPQPAGGRGSAGAAEGYRAEGRVAKGSGAAGQRGWEASGLSKHFPGPRRARASLTQNSRGPPASCASTPPSVPATGACPRNYASPAAGEVLLPPTTDCDFKIKLYSGDDYFLTSHVSACMTKGRGWVGAGLVPIGIHNCSRASSIVSSQRARRLWQVPGWPEGAAHELLTHAWSSFGPTATPTSPNRQSPCPPRPPAPRCPASARTA
jgi:hypothetical protein